MKKSSKILFFIILIEIFYCFFSYSMAFDISTNNYKENISTKNTSTKSSEITGSEDYYIESYDIKINVTKDNIYNITETIKAHFNTSKHGIQRVIPYKSTVIRNDGTQNKINAKIQNIYVSENYYEKKDKDNLTLKIGDASKLINGDHIYTINYTYNIGNDKLKDADEFYFNLIGNGWDTYIKNVTFTVNMPKFFDYTNTPIGFSAGKYGTIGTEDVEYTTDGTKITGNYKKTLEKNEGLTIRVTLPEKYFRKQKLDSFDKFAIALPIIFVLITFGYWKLFGKDDEVIETVEFEPPDDLNSLDVAYFYKGKVNDKDVVSLLIYLANKGYIKIEENYNKEYKIYKLKEYDGDNEIEKTFLDGLFAGGNKYNLNGFVTKNDLECEFYKTVNEIKNMEMSNERINKMYGDTKSFKQVAPLFLFIIVILLTLSSKLLKIGLEKKISIIYFFVNLFVLLVYYYKINGKIFNINVSITEEIKGDLFGLLIEEAPYIILMIIALLCFPAKSKIIDIDKTAIIEIIIQYISIFIICFFMNIMSKKTAYGTKINGRIRGFKRFIETAEKEEIEKLVNKDPQYFYNILPYAYVLGVTNAWIKNFESITTECPNWYYSYYGYRYDYFTDNFETNMESTRRTMVSVPHNSDSGFSDSSFGGGSGGGFSGGGFSGGGSGGGGGGSW